MLSFMGTANLFGGKNMITHPDAIARMNMLDDSDKKEAEHEKENEGES